MNKTDVIRALEVVREAKWKWAKAQTEFTSGVDAVMSRLLHEAARHRMSPEDVAHKSGFTAKRVRQMMRNTGLNPRDGKNLLSAKAAEALANNAALLGVEPSEMDLMSPLAYLPMGEQMKRSLQEQTVSKVTEVEGEACLATHPRMTVVSRCIKHGNHIMHSGTVGDEYGTIVRWANS